MSGISSFVLAGMMFIRAPIPPEPLPDPLARGYMGIQILAGTLTIESVEPGPAAKAGVKAHDVIIRVGSLEPQMFEQVVSHICSFRPGAIIEVEVMRGTERKVFKVKLGTRPARLDPPYDVEQVLPEK